MNKKSYETFLSQCQILQSLPPNRTLLQFAPTNQLLLLRKLQNISAQLIPILSQQKQIVHEHIESVIDYCQVSPDCVAVFTEYSTHTLEEELKARRINGKRFCLEELENVLVSVLRALGCLEDRAIGHGCVSRKDVVISHDGVVKLVDPALATSSPLDLISGYYYSPQLLLLNHSTSQKKSQSLQSSPQIQNLDFFKNDVFVLALFIVQLGLLNSNLDQCLMYDKGYLDYDILDKYLNQFQSLYPNQTFINLLCGMLQEDPRDRFSVKGALEFIRDSFGDQGDGEEGQDGDEGEEGNMQGSSASSYLYSSKGKTVKSFLLSQGPISSVGESLKQSQESLLYQNSRRNSLLPPIRLPHKTGKTPLIRC